jgi:hypothetical protein
VIGANNLEWTKGFALIALDRAQSAAGLDGMDRGEEVCGRRGVTGDHDERE